MRKQRMQPVTGDYTLQVFDDDHSIFLTGDAPKTIEGPTGPPSLPAPPGRTGVAPGRAPTQGTSGPPVTGAGAATAGYSVRVYNRGTQDASFAPQAPQTPTFTIAAGAAATLELGPNGIWSRS